MVNWIATYLLFFTICAQGAQIVRVGKTQRFLAISRTKNIRWQKGTRVCAFKGDKKLGCGMLVKLGRKGAIVKMDRANGFVAQGDEIRMQYPENRKVKRQEKVAAETEEVPDLERKPATKLMQSLEAPKVATDYWNLSGGISAGFTFFFPMIHLQRMLSSYVAIGIQPSYFRSSTDGQSVGAFGGMLTLSYYGNEYFRGFWGQIGGGLQFFSVDSFSEQESASALSLLGTVGWRGYWDLGLNVGVGAGLQFVKDPGFTTTDIRATGVGALFLLDVGFSF